MPEREILMLRTVWSSLQGVLSLLSPTWNNLEAGSSQTRATTWTRTVRSPTFAFFPAGDILFVHRGAAGLSFCYSPAQPDEP